MDLNRFTIDGKFLMLALDHRGSIKNLINPQNPEDVSKEDLVKLKSEIINSLKDQFSSLLIDQEYGLPAYKEKTKPFLLALEKTGFIAQGEERITELEYSVVQIKEQGASGAKLLIYFNPNMPSSGRQLATARHVMEECKSNNFPFFLEIVTYGQGTNLVEASVKRFIEEGIMPDVWKLPYPDSCREITNMLGTAPWILLTGGESFDVFKARLENAVLSGAKGFLAGRALWQEACSLKGEGKQKFLSETLPERFRIISQIVK